MLVVVAAWAGARGGGVADPAPGSARPLASEAAAPVPPPGYWMPVIVNGKSFPVARTNVLQLLSFTDNWHAPRLRLIDGEWLQVGRHEGIDITAERGTPILSMTAGTVEAVGWTFYSGTRVGIRGPDGRYYFYAHLDAVEPGIRPGASVKPGTVLGPMGNTGYGDPGHRDEFPPHLHFGIEAADGSRWVDPYATLVSLYDAAVRTHARWEARLRSLAASDPAAWEREVARRLMRPVAATGE